MIFFGFMAKKEPQNLISRFCKKKNGDPEDFPQTKKEEGETWRIMPVSK